MTARRSLSGNSSTSCRRPTLPRRKAARNGAGRSRGCWEGCRPEGRPTAGVQGSELLNGCSWPYPGTHCAGWVNGSERQDDNPEIFQFFRRVFHCFFLRSGSISVSVAKYVASLFPVIVMPVDTGFVCNKGTSKNCFSCRLGQAAPAADLTKSYCSAGFASLYPP